MYVGMESEPELAAGSRLVPPPLVGSTGLPEEACRTPGGLRWGLVGASTMALDWVGPAIREAGGEIIAVSSRTRKRGQEVAEALTVPEVYTDCEELLRSAQVDAVYVSSTNDLHAEQVVAALRAGVHALCEKPLSTTLDAADAMLEAAEDTGAVLATNHHLRNAPAHETIQTLVARGTIGAPLAARVFHASLLAPEWRGWRLTDPIAGAGVAFDLTVHSADLLRFVLQDEVAEVKAVSAPQRLAAQGIEDALMTVMRFNNGTLAYSHDAFTIRNAPTQLEVFGSEAAVVATDAMSCYPISRVFLRQGADVEQIQTGTPENLYVKAVRRFQAAVRGAGTPTATGRDGYESLKIALAARESAGSGSPSGNPTIRGAERRPSRARSETLPSAMRGQS